MITVNGKKRRFKVPALIGMAVAFFSMSWYGIYVYIGKINEKVAVDTTLSRMKIVEGALIVYREAMGSDPVDISSLQPRFLSQGDTETPHPVDRWDTEIVYDRIANTLISAGPDKKFGTEDDLIYPISERFEKK